MEAGKKRTRIVVERRIVTQDPTYGTSVEAWVVHKRLRGEVQDLLPSRGEQIADGVDIGNRPCRVRLRYRSDITSDMRLIIGARTLRIVTMPAEIHRGRDIELVAEELTTEGQQA
jgi:SPP1 family predicted phage head-tail adaptor